MRVQGEQKQAEQPGQSPIFRVHPPYQMLQRAVLKGRAKTVPNHEGTTSLVSAKNLYSIRNQSNQWQRCIRNATTTKAKSIEAFPANWWSRYAQTFESAKRNTNLGGLRFRGKSKQVRPHNAHPQLPLHDLHQFFLCHIRLFSSSTNSRWQLLQFRMEHNVT